MNLPYAELPFLVSFLLSSFRQYSCNDSSLNLFCLDYLELQLPPSIVHKRNDKFECVWVFPEKPLALSTGMLTLPLMLLKHSPIQTAPQPEHHVPPWIQPWLADQRSFAWFQCTPLKSACFQPTPEQSDNGCRYAWCDHATQVLCSLLSSLVVFVDHYCNHVFNSNWD